jgi:hypothetical protein
MPINTQQLLAADDAELLNQCHVDIYKASGPGGQHRNKVSSAVRLRHEPTGIMAHANDSRSQHDNKKLAIRRLRMNIACQIRNPADPEAKVAPAVVADCLHKPKKKTGKAGRVLQIGRKDRRFWQVGAWLLDLLEACRGRVGQAAANLGITTGNLVGVLKSDRHLLAAAQELRKRHDQKPLH